MDDDFIHLVPTKYTVKQRLNICKTDQIIFRHGHIAITNYHMGDNMAFEKSLSVWDKINFKYIMKGGYYVEALHEFRIGRGYDTRLLSKFFGNNIPVRVDNDAYPADKVDIKLLQPPRDDFQKVAITFMANQGQYRSNARFTQQMIDMPTGSGKLYCGIASSAFLSARTVIIVPFSKLLTQWRDGYLEFTDLKEDEIMIVQGKKACKKIIDGECEKVKVFIFMVDTIYSFVKSEGALEAIEMFRATKAYTKIIDEAHKDMKSIAMIDALCNFRMNYYMSASPGRSDNKENWIYKNLYINVPKFGSKFMTQEEKHINVMIKKYQFVPDMRAINRMVRPNVGMNSKLYEKELVSTPYNERTNNLKDAIVVMLNWSKKLVLKENKIMLMCGTIDMIHYLSEIAETVFPGEVGEYYGSLTKDKKEKALEKKVIVATSSSLGTGANIPGLQHIYNVSTYANWIDATQLPGRGRKLNNAQVVYCEFVNYGFRKTISQYERRKSVLLKVSKSGKIIVVE